MSNKDHFLLGEDPLSVELAIDLSQKRIKGVIGSESKRKIDKSHKAVQAIVDRNEIVYGINTGFGSLCNTTISPEETQKLQENILRSHSVGVGNPIARDLVRLMLILKLHSLAMGYSGISLTTLERILWYLENDYMPLVPSQGSVGASGDLAPLAHLFLPLIGLGEIWDGKNYVVTSDIFKKENINLLILGPKEGLALINGTQFIATHATKIVYKLQNCLDVADIIGAMTLEGILGSVRPNDEELHNIRPFPGNQLVAHRLRQLLMNSEMIASHVDCDRIQDPYSIRCMSQVHGSSRDAWAHLKHKVEIEINSVTDNPVIFHEHKIISGGNFHGQPLAMTLDYAGLAASELGNISDRRTYLLLEGRIEGLLTLLMRNTGINSGFMIPQYTSAALVSENKSLCYPASADSIPTSLGQEDHVSMGSISGRKTLMIIENLENILAVELLCAAQAFDYRRPLKSGKILEACHNLIRSRIDHAEEDRVFAKDIKAAHEMIESGELVKLTNEVAKSENIDLNGKYHEELGLY